METLFYVKNERDSSIWAITKYSTDDPNRLGWLSGKCVAPGTDTGNYIGADIGMDAQYVFTSGKYDFSKKLELLTPAPSAD